MVPGLLEPWLAELCPALEMGPFNSVFAELAWDLCLLEALVGAVVPAGGNSPAASAEPVAAKFPKIKTNAGSKETNEFASRIVG